MPPDDSFLTATRDSYDAIALEYADMVGGDIEARVVDRALLAAFAELVQANGGGPVVDVGCGPGRITTVLHQLGLDAFGIDLSPAMVELARHTHPQLRFEVGSMLGLDLLADSLGGLLAYYSIIHVPRGRRGEVFAEFFRVLVPGGPLMLAYQVGDDISHYDEAFGKVVRLDFHRQQPLDVGGLVRAAGFDVLATVVKEPEGTDRTQQAITLARKPCDETGQA
ncbi:MAG TPA: class I SAM-dependent methyltransferase [Actinoplanes sp.]|nr:class I SAM-dependent methyltransferase [Actinoplanes sp.]